MSTKKHIYVNPLGGVKEIDYKWNYSGLGIREFKENSQRLNDAYVLHWSGEKKPWFIESENESIKSSEIISKKTITFLFLSLDLLYHLL